MKRTGCSMARRLAVSRRVGKFRIHLVKLPYALIGGDPGHGLMNGRWSRSGEDKGRHDMFRLTQAREQLCGKEIRAGPCVG